MKMNQAMRILSAFLMLLCVASIRADEPNASAADKLGWQLALHARTLKKYNLFEAMDKTAAIGIKCFSLSASVPFEGTNETSCLKLTDAQIKKIKSYAAGKGLKLVNAYLPLPADEAECRKSYEFVHKMGIDIIVGEPKPSALETVEKLCKEYNIKVAIHDHPQPSHYWNPKTVLDAIKGRSALLGACADTGHWMRSGLDPVQCLRELEGHIICLHFKDLTERKRAAHDVPWGTGVGNCAGIMEELKRQNFKGAFCIEYEYNWDNNLPEVVQCKKFFDNTCAALIAKSGE
jgi:sugar phosphate isomerase/epimerase